MKYLYTKYHDILRRNCLYIKWLQNERYSYCPKSVYVSITWCQDIKCDFIVSCILMDRYDKFSCVLNALKPLPINN